MIGLKWLKSLMIVKILSSNVKLGYKLLR